MKEQFPSEAALDVPWQSMLAAQLKGLASQSPLHTAIGMDQARARGPVTDQLHGL